MVERVLAAVRTAPNTTELRELPRPELSDDSALLKVEVAGICGTDVKMYSKPPFDEPVIMGHENVGIIAAAGFLTPMGAAAFGWFAYAPLSNSVFSPGIGGDLWVLFDLPLKEALPVACTRLIDEGELQANEAFLAIATTSED